MDERRLTAWLITEGVLTSDQIKTALTEQIRLQRAGTTIDVIGVARRLKLLTDVKVLEVIERTGYRPVGDDAGGRRPAPSQVGGDVSSEGSVSGEVASVSADASASASDASASAPEVTSIAQTVPLGSSKAPPPPAPSEPESEPLAGSASGSRRKASRAAGARRPISRSSGMGALVLAAFAVPIVVFVFAGGSTPAPYDGPTPHRASSSGGGRTPVAPRGPGAASSAANLALDDLQSGLRRLEQSPGMSKEERTSTINQLHSILDRLRAGPLANSHWGLLDAAERRLATLEGAPTGKGGLAGGGTEWVKGEAGRVEDARVDQAWSTMTSNFERILWLSLQQPRSALQQAAETQRGVDLRQHVSAVIRDYTAKGPDGVASLVGAEDLHPVFGVGGYESLLREARRFPQELQTSERWRKWQQIIPQFEALRDRAAAYARAIRAGEQACIRGKTAEAKAAFTGGQYADDPWWAACRQLLDRPDVVTALAARAKAAAAGEVVDGDVFPGRPTGGTQVAWGKGWKERFLALAGQHKRAKADERTTIAADIGRVLAETLGLAKQTFEQCKEIIGVYDQNAACFKAEASLQAPLKEHHTLYFEGAFSRATGPQAFRQLDGWCEAHGYDAWRARLKPYLRLLAGANSPAARQREAGRRNRSAVEEQVEEFSRDRVNQVEKGLSSVVAWLTQRSYAPASVKQELSDTIARAVERAGNPVAGARLREELKAIENKERPADELASLEKDYQKQLKGVIDEAVKKSLQGVERCLSAGQPGLAFDLFGYVLLLDPENDKAHKGLGHVKVDGKWVRRFEAEKLRQGMAWDHEKGWVKTADKARYDKGEFWDFVSDKWTTVADANRAHMDPGSPWTVQTEHFMLRSTADLPITIRIAERLEAFYLNMFRQYDLFFTMKGDPASLIFGVSPGQDKPLLVHFYRDEAQFRAHANPPTSWAAGFYSGGQHASFFYDMGNSYSVTVLQHEIVHQILGETAGSGGGADAWLAEGAAVYLEDAFFRDGVLTDGGLEDHSRIVAYKAACKTKGAEHRMADVLKLRSGSDWDSGDISKNYRGAGAVVYFLCNFDDGRYRADFVEFLRDAYYGRNPRFDDYFGLSAQMLDSLMQRFYDPSSALDPAGAAGAGLVAGANLEESRDTLVKLCGEKDVDVDQLSQSYGLLRDALRGAPQKEADAARGRAERALLALRKKQVKVIEAAAKKEQSGNRAQRLAQLQQLRAAALAVINDPAQYPDADHGRAGQPLVDEKVNALRAVWQSTPASLEDPEVKTALDVLEVTQPWLAELEVETKKVGDETAAAMRKLLMDSASLAGSALTPADQARIDNDRKVREWNESQTQLAPEIRDQVRFLNDYRAMLGIGALAIDARLCTAAAKHSQWMEQTGIFDHNETSAARRTPGDRCKAEGYEGGVGENIAFGYPSAESVHLGWYNSSGHHRNMIHVSFFQIGVGKAGTYWTQNFGTSKPAL